MFGHNIVLIKFNLFLTIIWRRIIKQKYVVWFNCENITFITRSLSIDKLCFTFFSTFGNYFYRKDLFFKSVTIGNREGFFHIHDQNQLPSYRISRYLTIAPISSTIIYQRYIFNRLPAPYDTQCHEYGITTKSQSKCISDCYIKFFLNKHKCIPKFDNNFAFII